MNALEFAITDGMHLARTQAQHRNEYNYGAKPLRG